jgi:hypothetical protein
LLETAVREIARHSSEMGRAVPINWRDEVTIRGRLLGVWPNGQESAGGACRLLRCVDGWIALTLAREWDVAALPALIEGPIGEDHWSAVTGWVATHRAAEVVERARLLNMAAAQVDSIPTTTPIPLGVEEAWPSSGPRRLEELRVVDLSSLWAGPLVARILRDAGATVIKVESATRPDGARAVPPFYRAFHDVNQLVETVDLATEEGRGALRRLVADADVVIEASRPRALEQLGTGPHRVPDRPGRVWLSITGYGRTGPGADWIAFGDDAAVAGGLVDRTEDGQPVFCSDAAADPLTGLVGAAAVLRSLAGGGGALIDLALAGAAAAINRGTARLEPS